MIGRIKRLSAGRIGGVADAPAAPVVMVLGAMVAPDATPMPMLAARLDVAVRLVAAGTAQRVLVSGNAAGESGDEIVAMTNYLVAAGIDPALIDPDPFGLCTWDSCLRAKHTFGIDRMLVATQAFHLPRAVAECRTVGIDAYGVIAENNCRPRTLARSMAREWLLARPKALIDLVRQPQAALAR